jgi:chromosomal replication initiator protein
MDDIDVIARRRKLHREDILGPSRYKKIVDARHECIALFRSRGLSTPAIGRIMQRDHSSIVHALQRIKKKAVTA